MNIQPIIEGHGEMEALPVLLRRLRDESRAYGLDVGRPIRMRRSQLVQQDPLQKAVALACKQPECAAILVLFDADDACPKEKAPRIEKWAQAATRVPCALVMARTEYEAWFLAAIESLRGQRRIRSDATSPEEPETVRDAKGALEERMEEGASYMATTDQAPLSALFDMKQAFAKCRSFRQLVKAFGELAVGTGLSLPTWPPTTWTQGVR